MSAEDGDNSDLAFPCPAHADQEGSWFTGATGMLLRDWFAGQALTAMQAGSAKLRARMAYEIADAMLEARTLK